MNTITQTKRRLLEQEATVFSLIPGMEKPRNTPGLDVQYPDAAFAHMILDGLHAGDREQNEIHQRAYLAILNGEPISGVRFRYDRDMDAYLVRHMWD